MENVQVVRPCGYGGARVVDSFADLIGGKGEEGVVEGVCFADASALVSTCWISVIVGYMGELFAKCLSY